MARPVASKGSPRVRAGIPQSYFLERMAQTCIEPSDIQKTLDLAVLARINRGDRVEVGEVFDSTQDLFTKTLALLQKETEGRSPDSAPRGQEDGDRFVPQNKDLRSIYLLAEAVGGYETFHDLVNVHSPGGALSRDFQEKALRTALNEEEVRALQDYSDQIHVALANANAYLRDVAGAKFSRDELHELYQVILTASERQRELNRIMGNHLMHRIERSVQRLYEIQEKIRKVERTIDGIFMVDSELMFIPTNELIDIVKTVFDGLGNPYLSRNVDGVMLLAARNLLIEVTSFYSYYGKNQIYRVLKRAGSNVSSLAITTRIHYEIRRLFEACKRDNKLVLTRVMKDTQREFELSVEAIQQEAEYSAVHAVRGLLPPDEPVKPVAKKGFLRRVWGWLVS